MLYYNCPKGEELKRVSLGMRALKDWSPQRLKKFQVILKKPLDKLLIIGYNKDKIRERKGQPQREVATMPSKTQSNDPYRMVCRYAVYKCEPVLVS